MKTIITFGFMVLLSISTVLLGDVIYAEDFETFSAVSWPCDPNTVFEIDGWAFESDPNNGIVVINDDEPGTFDGENYLRVGRTGNSYVQENFGGKYAAIEFEQPLTGNISLTFSFLQTNGDMILSFITDDADLGAESVSLWFGPTGYVSYMNYGLYETVAGLKYAQNEWNQVRIDADYVNGTYDLYLNGDKVEMDFSYVQSEFSQIAFTVGGRISSSTLYLDAIKIETGTTDCSVPLEADLNGDCQVNLIDLSVLADSWMISNISPVVGN